MVENNMSINLKIDNEDEISLPVDIYKSKLSLSEIGAIVILMCMDATGDSSVLNRIVAKDAQDAQEAFKGLIDKGILKGEFSNGELKFQLDLDKLVLPN